MANKVGILTFHGAHNYGSSLQAFALQKAIERLGFDCEIINFRTSQQKDQYAPLTKRKGVKYVLKNGYFLLNYKSRVQKHKAFEAFIQSKLKKSKAEYASADQLRETEMAYSHYISGSDQIWNTTAQDSSTAYFLPFVKTKKKIAYAPSFGPLGRIKSKEEIKAFLSEYHSLSVREDAGQELVEELTGIKAPVLPDPTMLLPIQDWDGLIDAEPVINGEYIFFYSLFASPEMISIGKALSKRLHMPVVISNVSNQYEIFSGFQKKLSCGPLQFLNLIKNARYVCTSSFHGTVFSLLMHKPLVSMRGMADNRISTLLKMTGTEFCSISCAEEIDDGYLKKINTIDFENVDERIQLERKRGIDYLRDALG